LNSKKENDVTKKVRSRGGKIKRGKGGEKKPIDREGERGRGKGPCVLLEETIEGERNIHSKRHAKEE